MRSSSLRRGVVADRQGRAHGSLGVILVGGRRTEDRHDRITDELLDGAAVPDELIAHLRVVGAKERLHVLGVHLLGLCREADEVAEEHRHDLAFHSGDRRRGELAHRTCHTGESRRGWPGRNWGTSASQKRSDPPPARKSPTSAGAVADEMAAATLAHPPPRTRRHRTRRFCRWPDAMCDRPARRSS